MPCVTSKAEVHTKIIEVLREGRAVRDNCSGTSPGRSMAEALLRSGVRRKFLEKCGSLTPSDDVALSLWISELLIESETCRLEYFRHRQGGMFVSMVALIRGRVT